MRAVFSYTILGFLLMGSGLSQASLYIDDFSADTSANYEQFWNNGTFTHNTSNGSLDYARTLTGWRSDAYLVRTNVFSMAGLNTLTFKTEITFGETTTGAQAGLLFAAGNNEAGFVVYNHDATGQWRLAQMPLNLNDPTNLVTNIGAFDGLGTYQITVTLDRSGPTDAIFSAEIVGANNTRSISNFTVAGGATYGGQQVGLWVRNSTDEPTQSFGYLEVIPEPGAAALLLAGGAVIALLRRRHTCL